MLHKPMPDHFISVALDPCSTITGFACAFGAEWRQLQSPKAERLTVDTTGGPHFLLNSYAEDRTPMPKTAFLMLSFLLISLSYYYLPKKWYIV